MFKTKPAEQQKFNKNLTALDAREHLVYNKISEASVFQNLNEVGMPLKISENEEWESDSCCLNFAS